MAKNKRDTAAAIRNAARREFSQVGYAGARVARIAQRAGVNKQLIFYYFGSKAGLFRAVVESARVEVAARLPAPDAEGRATERLRGEVARVFDAFSARPELVRLLFLDPRHTDEMLPRMRRELRDIVSAGQGLGFFRDDADPDLAAQQALVLTLGYLGLEPALGTSEPSARPRWRDAAADLLVQSLSW